MFAVNYPGSVPYLYHDKNENKYKGIIPDILAELINTNQLDIRFVSNSRKRSEEYIYSAKADLIMLSKAWLKYPEKVIFTVPVHQHRSFLYKRTDFAKNFTLNNLSNENKPQLICTREGYYYPFLDDYFSKNILTRLDSSNHASMLKMLFKKRCNLMVMNEYNATSLMNAARFKDKKLYRSVLPVSIVPLNIVLRPELSRQKEVLDNHINKLKRSGELERIIKKILLISYSISI